MEIKSRHHLRRDAIEAIKASLEDTLGIELPAEGFERVTLVDADVDLVMVDGEPAIFELDDEAFLTVRGANAFDPTDHLVTVDAGAVPFVSDGADIMRPGIVDADEAIRAGDLVVIVEVTHGKALAIGRTRVDGDDLLGESGKVIDTIHHVGDDLYAFIP